MFSGCFTSYDATWVITPCKDKKSKKEVEEALKEQAREAIKDKTPLIWLYWPYADPGHGQDIENVLGDFVRTELKTDAWFRRLTRRGILPTHLKHERKAHMVILHIKGREIMLGEAQGGR